MKKDNEKHPVTGVTPNELSKKKKELYKWFEEQGCTYFQAERILEAFKSGLRNQQVSTGFYGVIITNLTQKCLINNKALDKLVKQLEIKADDQVKIVEAIEKMTECINEKSQLDTLIHIVDFNRLLIEILTH